MRKFKILPLLLLVAIIAMACSPGNPNDDLSKDEIVDKAVKDARNLESAAQDVELVIINDLEQGSEELVQNIEAEFMYGGEGTITHVHTLQENDIEGNEQIIEFYKVPEDAYIKTGGMWQKFTGSENYSTTYKPILETLKSSIDYLEVEEEDEHYLLSYKGKDAELFNIIKVPFSIEYPSFDPNNIELDVFFKVEKESMRLVESYFGTEAILDENNRSEVNGAMEFYDFNDIDEIIVPEEAKNIIDI